MTQEMLIPEPDPKPETGTARFKVELDHYPKAPRVKRDHLPHCRWEYTITTLHEEDYFEPQWENGSPRPWVISGHSWFKFTAERSIKSHIKYMRKKLDMRDEANSEVYYW